MHNAVILIQARFDSKRCPGKILRHLDERTTCLSYLVKRLSKADYNCIVATTDRAEDAPLTAEVTRLRAGRAKHLIGIHHGNYRDIARRLYEASEGYDYIIRVTGDDIFIDYEILNQQAAFAMKHELDYCYSSIIRGCDCDVFKREALEAAMQEYNTAEVESIEFLFKNEKWRIAKFKIPESYNSSIHNFSLTLDTEEDYHLIEIVYNRLAAINPFFTTFDIVEFFTRNAFLSEINKTPLVSVYTVFKDYPLDWLDLAISSLRIQSFTDWEFILIDYGSRMIHQYIKKIHNEETFRTFFIEDQTFIQAIQFAMTKAKGKYIMRLDADDILDPEALENMVTYLQKNPFYSAVIPDHYIFTDTLENTVVEKGDILNLPTCALIEKKKYQYVRFLETQQFRDGTSWIEAFKKLDFLIGYYNAPLFYYRIHDKSLTHGAKTQEEIQELDAHIRTKYKEV